jgi:excisionase family DNA binding protein
LSGESQLALALVATLDDAALDALARRLAPYFASAAAADGAKKAIAYTVATLADELGLSQRAIRGAIERGELPAVKRGGRWLIDAVAVAVWVQPAPTPTPVVAPPRARRRASSRRTLTGVMQSLTVDEATRAVASHERPHVRLLAHTDEQSDPGDAPTSRGPGQRR